VKIVNILEDLPLLSGKEYAIMKERLFLPKRVATANIGNGKKKKVNTMEDEKHFCQDCGASMDSKDYTVCDMSVWLLIKKVICRDCLAKLEQKPKGED